MMDIRTLSSRGYSLWGERTIFTTLEADYTIWDGTTGSGIQTDWLSTGVGIEDPSAAYEGGSGFLVVGESAGTSVLLHNIDYTEKDINNYDFFSFWINVRNWTSGYDITISLYSTVNKSSDYLALSDYVNFDKLQQWQRVMLPLERFNIRKSWDVEATPTYINELEFVLGGGVDFWMDDLALTIGDWNNLPIGPPDIESISFEENIIPVMSPFSTS